MSHPLDSGAVAPVDSALFKCLSRRIVDVAYRHAAGEPFFAYFDHNSLRIGIGKREQFEYLPGSKDQVDPFAAASRWCQTQLMAKDISVYGFVSFDVAGYHHSYIGDGKLPLIRLIKPRLELEVTPGQLSFRGETPERQLALDVLACMHQDKGEAPISQLIRQAALLDDPENYRDRVAELVHELRHGRLDKAILSRRVNTPAAVDWLGTFDRGMLHSQFCRSYLFDHGAIKAVGFTPETLLVSHGNTIATNPLAGTRRRGRDAIDEARMIRELRRDPKEIKEHAISVLLAQEELLRVCEPDSVAVREFMALKQYRTVQHLSSRVGGVLRPAANWWDAMRELFPGVTVSGIGKSDAIGAIGRYESESRGLYAGCVGVIDAAGDADFALSIRSLFEVDGRSFWQAGAGIIPESDPNLEFKETCHKLATMLEITSFT